MFDRLDGSLVRVRECRYGRMMYLANDRYIGHALEQYGEYSEAEVDFWRQLLRPDMVVVDAGANLGAHTVALARLVPQGFVLAAEPLQALYYLLCGNVALNGLAHVKAVHVALGAERGSLLTPLLDYTIEENYGGLALGAFERGRRVPVVPLDELLPVVHFIKADVEGMEQQVLAGAARLLRDHRPILYVENNPESGQAELIGPRQQVLIDFIHAQGYRLWWHHPRHFNPANFRGSSIDAEPGVVSFNMLGLPEERPADIVGCIPIERAHRAVLSTTEARPLLLREFAGPSR